MGCCEMRLAQLGALVSAGRSAGRADDSRAIGRENLVLEGDFRVLSHSDGHFRGALTGEWTCGPFFGGPAEIDMDPHTGRLVVNWHPPCLNLRCEHSASYPAR